MGDGTAGLPNKAETPAESRIAELEAELVQQREEAEACLARLRTVSKAYADTQTEMRAYKDRMESRAKLDSELQAHDRVKALFDPVMNLRRSIDAAGTNPAKLVDGLRMVLQQFMDALHKLGLEEVPGVGSTFDPNVHEAVGVAPVDDPALDNRVVEVHKAGYAVKGRVLDAARVVIGKWQEPAGEA
jgi:molecular chaperone GrpE